MARHTHTQTHPPHRPTRLLPAPSATRQVRCFVGSCPPTASPPRFSALLPANGGARFSSEKRFFTPRRAVRAGTAATFRPQSRVPSSHAQPRAPGDPRQRGPGAGLPATERPRRDLRRPALLGGKRAPPPTARVPATAPQRPPPALRMRPPARPGPAPAGSSARPACARAGALLPPAA